MRCEFPGSLPARAETPGRQPRAFHVDSWSASNHVTKLPLDRPVNLGPQVIRLRPAPIAARRSRAMPSRSLPSEHFVNWQQDPHGNWLARLVVFLEKTPEFSTSAVDFVADMQVYNSVRFFSSKP